MTRETRTLREDRCTFMTICCRILLRLRNISDKSRRENQNTHFMFKHVFIYKNRAVYEIMWKNNVESGRTQTLQHGGGQMRFAYRINSATHTHTHTHNI